MAGLIGDRQSKLLPEPVLELHVAGEARWGCEAGWQLREARGWQPLLAGWGASLCVGQEGREPPVALGA
jgi:hypothetical protein